MLSSKAAHRKDTRSAPATFTHQHFRKVAEIIRSLPCKDSGPMGIVWPIVAVHFADALATTNPNFDRARFLAACKGE